MFRRLGLFRRNRDLATQSVAGNARTEPQFGGEIETVPETVARESTIPATVNADCTVSGDSSRAWPDDPDATPQWLQRSMDRREELGIGPLPYRNRRQYEMALQRALELIGETDRGTDCNSRQKRGRHPLVKDEALADLRGLLADEQFIASQNWLAWRWNRQKSTVSRWISEWERTGSIAAVRYQSGKHKCMEAAAKSETVAA